MVKFDFHREVKPFIISDEKTLGYLKKLQSSNPDVGHDDTIIYPKNPGNNGNWIKKRLDINDYI